MRMSDEDLRRRVAAAYDEVLDEPVPDRLSALLAAPKVIDLAAQREKRRITWAQLGGMAAAVLVGIGLGWQFAPREGDALVAERGGALVAASSLARALDTQLAAERGDVAVQLTFLDQGGRYCRTFAAQQLAGLACREGGQWSVVATARAEATGGNGMRQAASSLPRPVLDAVDARIAGAALDAAKEKQARDAGWRR